MYHPALFVSVFGVSRKNNAKFSENIIIQSVNRETSEARCSHQRI